MIFHFKVNRNSGKTYDHCFYSDSKHILYKKYDYLPRILLTIFILGLLIISGIYTLKTLCFIFAIVFACLIVSFINFERFREINKNQNEIEQFLFDNSVTVFHSILDNDHETSLLMYLYEDYVHVLILEGSSFYKYSCPENCNDSFKIVHNNKSLSVRDFSINGSFNVFRKYHYLVYGEYYSLFENDFVKMFKKAESFIIENLKKYNIVRK